MYCTVNECIYMASWRTSCKAQKQERAPEPQVSVRFQLGLLNLAIKTYKCNKATI